MARSFGEDRDKDGNGKGDENRGPPPDQGAAWNGGCCVDEEDSTGNAQVAQTEDISEDAAEGQHLYLDFMRQEIMRNGMQTELLCPDLSNGQSVHEITNPQRQLDWTRAGQELRQLADAFSQSKERQTVRKRAENVSVESLDFHNFMQMLQELFQVQWFRWLSLILSLTLNTVILLFFLFEGGITRERILILFFFCADVAIEALRKGFHTTFHQLLGWSLRYISTNLAAYVHSMGGWGVVLRQSLDVAYQVTACCAFVAVVAACVVYIRRNL